MEGLKNIRILVTGGCGFVGSHLVEELVKKSASVVVPYRSIDPLSYFTTKKLNKKTVLVYADISDFRRIFDIVTKYEIEYIFHLAAQSIVTTAYDNPLETLFSNSMGTANILEAGRLYGKMKGIIVASSDKAYGKKDKPYKETDALRGDHPYEVSKSGADLIAQTYIKTYGMPIVITRFGNIYGEGDLNFNRIIPEIMNSLHTKTKLEVRSNGLYIREYTYVKDVVSAYLYLLSSIDNVKGEAFNISSGISMSVLELIKTIGKITHKKIGYTILNNAKNEIITQRLDCSKIRKLGWKPRYSFHDGIVRTYKWYKLL